MLCTFTSLEELKAFSSENARLHDDAIVFQASSAEEGSFIGLLLSHSNVSAVHEERTVEDLKEKFPSVDTALVDAVWKGQQSWGACFDILNSLRCSTKSKTLLLEDSSFLQDAISWPELSASQSVQNSTWTIDSVQSLSAALGHVGISDSLDSWEILNKPTSPYAAADTGVTEGTVANLTVDGTRRGTVRSYREALLKSPSKEQSSAAAAAAELSAEMARKKVAQWKPSIVVQAVKYEHKDKLYQHNIPAGATVSAYEQEDEDESFGSGSYYQSNEFAKGMVSVSRMRAATMLKPAALEKKMARIASRAALRPPVPGTAAAGRKGGDDSD